MCPPFMKDQQNGTIAVNTIRIVEQLVGAVISSLIILGGGYYALVEKLDNTTTVMSEHVKMDIEKQKDLHDWMIKQKEITVRHNTVLRQEGLLK